MQRPKLSALSGYIALMMIWVAIAAPMLASPDLAPHQASGPQGLAAVAFSPDGKTIASGGAGGELVLWDAKDGRRLKNLPGHDGTPITGISFSPGGTTLASVARDTTVRIWDLAGAQMLSELTGHEHPIRALALSGDGAQIATAGEDTRVLLWTTASGDLRRVLNGHVDAVSALAFSKDGSLLASGGADDRIVVWDARTGRRLQTLLGHAGDVTGLAFQNNKFLISSSEDGTVRRWDAQAGQQTRVFRESRGRGVRSAATSGDGATLAAGDENNEVLLIDAASDQLRARLARHSAPVTALAFSPDGKAIVSAGEDNLLVLWDASNGRVRWTAQAPQAGGSATASIPLLGARAAQAAPPGPGAQIYGPLAAPQQALVDGPGGPLLLIYDDANPFSSYLAEILRNEGLNLFASAEIDTVTPASLAGYDVAVLGQMPISPAQATMFSDWVDAGGNLIAMRPDPDLAGLLGLSAAGGSISDAYLLMDTGAAPANGLVGETIQFHGQADRYSLSGATAVATLYSSATAATSFPAVTLRSVGSNGGQAAAFTFDLARSVVLTRQGNPAWVGQERDGFGPIRSDDLYFGAAAGDAQPDWVNLDKVAIPQADEQQRLLANLILQTNADRKPLPRFWYFPRGERAVVIMTGDDHANGGTAARFEQYKASSPAGCSVADWECIRSTSYIYPNTPLSGAQASGYHADGFEVALHVNTGCVDFTTSSLTSDYSSQLSQFGTAFSGIPLPKTNRTHCLVWSDWDSQPSVELANGIRLDTGYYYWPGSWALNRPGHFTGSGLPMRFAALNGALIDVYQANTQNTDESGQSYPATIDALLDKATGPEGYFAAVTANAHTDNATSGVSDAIINSALSRGVPVVSAQQMLTWLDGRNGSSFGGLSWAGNQLSFSVSAAAGSNGLQAMLPNKSGGLTLLGLTRDGGAASFSVQTIKGVEYATFPATAGSYVASYGSDTTPPTIDTSQPAAGSTNVSQSSAVSVTFSEAMDPASIDGARFELRDGASALIPATVSYDAAARQATLAPNATLPASTTFTAIVRGGAAGAKDLAGNPLASDSSWSFTTASPPNCPCTIFGATEPGAAPSSDPNGVELGVKFQSSLDGYISGVRFYKGAGNTGTHLGSLWRSDGTLLAQATFSAESASGWQEVSFATPVAISANTTYIASYFAPSGGYHVTNNGFSSAVTNGPLTALADSIAGGNGVYRYTGASAFPNNSYLASNYWVDPIFVVTTGPLPTNTPTPTVDPNAPTSTATNTPTNTPTSTPTSPPTSTPTPLSSGAYTLFDGTQTPAVAADPDPNPIEVGVRFQASADGYISGVRFYKGAGNTGTHLGSLWRSDGTLLAQATFSAESASGWQEVSFATPVAISANTTYIASYFAPAGRYSVTEGFFNNEYLRDPLRAPSSAAAGGNGVYRYGSSGFPTNSYAASNYWVDVIYQPAGPLPTGTSTPTATNTATTGPTSTPTHTPTNTPLGGPCAAPANPVVAENCLPGSPPSEWDISGVGDAGVQGFATDISVNKGGTIQFKIDTTAGAYRIDIYRLGYYGGQGARLVHSIPASQVTAQNQPNCLSQPSTGLVDCGNWAVSASWAVPSTAVSGIYIARPVRSDNGGASHIVFIVRDDARSADLLFQTSDTTWQAYNSWGGNSLYAGGPGANPGRAYKVSYNRPFNTRIVDGGQDWLFNAEYPMLRWLERNGYDVAYTTGVDSHRRGNLIANHRVFLSVGHDEYWSGPQRASVEAARDAGSDLAFFSGNELFWKIRYENSIDGSSTANRTMVSYKETHANAKIDPSSEWTGTWRDPRFSPPSDGGRPENALTGTLFAVNCCDGVMQVPAEFAPMRFWRNTSVAGLGAGQTASFASGILGYEWDETPDDDARPAGMIRLSRTTATVGQRLLDYGSTYGSGSVTHSLSLYRAPGGALVFGAGTIQWAWGLDATHDRAGVAADPRIQQATLNLFADMGAQPATLMSGLIAASPSADATAPNTTISSPAAGSEVPIGQQVTISGSASDSGGVVALVEVSIDGGASWRAASGRGSWTYRFTPQAQGPLTVLARAVDDSVNIETTPASLSLTVGVATCPCSLWSDTTVPGLITDGDPNATELGVKFTATQSGYITGIRFYKGPQNTGTHTGSLWSAGGALLARVTFQGESASGWQQASFATPVAVTAGTVYVASYHAPNGKYSQDTNYFTSSYSNGPLRALADGESGPNGVYAWSATPAFPTLGYNALNSYVDVVFVETLGPSATSDPSAPTSTPTATPTNTATPTATSTPTSSPTPLTNGQLTAVASDDSFVRSGNPTTNYGTGTSVRARLSGPAEVAYLKFSVAGAGGPIEQARLRLFVSDGSNAGGSVYLAPNTLSDGATAWTNTNIVWDNAPGTLGAPLAVLGAVATGGFVEVDVSAAVGGNGTYSFAITSNSTDPVSYSSREAATAANRPQLILTVGGAGDPPATATNTPTQAAGDPGLIFADGLESGGLGAWAGVSDGEGDLRAAPAAALAGAYGLAALIDNNSAMYLADTTPAGEARYRASFRLDPNSAAMLANDVHRIFAARSASVELAYLELGFGLAGYQIRAAVRRDSGTYAVSGWTALSDAPHALELSWQAATAAGANNGALSLTVDGAPAASLTAVDNDTHRVEEARLGPLAGIDSSTRGTFYYDDFVARRD